MKIADTWFKQLKGLMLDNTPNAELKFVFKKPTMASVHTLFMRYSIQVQWCNASGEVLEEKVLNPWVINYTPKQECWFFVERRISE